MLMLLFILSVPLSPLALLGLVPLQLLISLKFYCNNVFMDTIFHWFLQFCWLDVELIAIEGLFHNIVKIQVGWGLIVGMDFDIDHQLIDSAFGAQDVMKLAVATCCCCCCCCCHGCTGSCCWIVLFAKEVFLSLSFLVTVFLDNVKIHGHIFWDHVFPHTRALSPGWHTCIPKNVFDVFW